MGFRVEAILERAGFYPNGGGRCRVRIEPVERRSPTRPDAADTTTRAGSEIGALGLRSLELPARSRRGDEAEQDIRLLTSAATATVCLIGLPRSIAEREQAVLEKKLVVSRDRTSVDACSGALGPGNSVHLHVPLDGYTEVFSGFGSLKVSSEQVSSEQVAGAVVAEAEPFLRSGAAVGEHLADQLLLPLALGTGGRFTTTEPSGHTRTNIDVIREFLETEITMKPVDERLWEIAVEKR